MAQEEKLSKEFIVRQKKRLLQLKMEIANNIKLKHKESVQVSSDEMIEDGDQAQNYLDQNLDFGLRERELFRLREIEAALARIEDGSYGICEETDEIIGQKRLEKIPWTRLSIYAAEDDERENGQYVKKAA
ncbi:MAG: TraR/DksA family transcriptional regulator [Halobacteriovoraceae bacterium]|nr:TraR/DksA family transcriptional regulator [Halobacteriovoraceae bacterium]